MGVFDFYNYPSFKSSPTSSASLSGAGGGGSRSSSYSAPAPEISSQTVTKTIQQIQQTLPKGSTVRYNPNTKEITIYNPYAPESSKEITYKGDPTNAQVQATIARDAAAMIQEGVKSGLQAAPTTASYYPQLQQKQQTISKPITTGSQLGIPSVIYQKPGTALTLKDLQMARDAGFANRALQRDLTSGLYASGKPELVAGLSRSTFMPSAGLTFVESQKLNPLVALDLELKFQGKFKEIKDTGLPGGTIISYDPNEGIAKATTPKGKVYLLYDEESAKFYKGEGGSTIVQKASPTTPIPQPTPSPAGEFKPPLSDIFTTEGIGARETLSKAGTVAGTVGSIIDLTAQTAKGALGVGLGLATFNAEETTKGMALLGKTGAQLGAGILLAPGEFIGGRLKEGVYPETKTLVSIPFLGDIKEASATQKMALEFATFGIVGERLTDFAKKVSKDERVREIFGIKAEELKVGKAETRLPIGLFELDKPLADIGKAEIPIPKPTPGGLKPSGLTTTTTTSPLAMLPKGGGGIGGGGEITPPPVPGGGGEIVPPPVPGGGGGGGITPPPIIYPTRADITLVPSNQIIPFAEDFKPFEEGKGYSRKTKYIEAPLIEGLFEGVEPIKFIKYEEGKPIFGGEGKAAKGAGAKKEAGQEVVKVSLPSFLEIGRESTLLATSKGGKRIEVKKSAEFKATENFAIPENAGIRVSDEIPAKFTRTIDTTFLTETKGGRLSGRISKVEAAGEAIIKQGEFDKITAPPEPYGDLLDLARSSQAKAGKEVITIKKGLGGLVEPEAGALVKYGEKLLSTEKAALSSPEDLKITLFTKEQAKLFEEPIERGIAGGREGLITPAPRKSVAAKIEERTILDIRPQIETQPSKIYQPRYFGREPKFGFGDIGKAPRSLEGIKLPPRTVKALKPFIPEIEGRSPYGLKLITGMAAISAGKSFKRLKPFETPAKPKGGAEAGGGKFDLVSTAAGKGTAAQQFIRQKYKGASKAIPASALTETKTVTVTKSAFEKIAEARQANLLRRRTRVVEDYGFETTLYPASFAFAPKILEVTKTKEVGGTKITNFDLDKIGEKHKSKQIFGFGFKPITGIATKGTTAQTYGGKTTTIAGTDFTNLTKTVAKDAFTDLQKQKTGIDQIFRQKQPTAIYTVTKPPGGGTTEKPPKLIPDLPNIRSDSLISKRKGEDMGFNVYARKRGNFVKLNPSPLEKNQARILGGEATDNSAAATFKIEKTNKPANRNLQYGFSFNSFKFTPIKITPEKEVYREKNTYRIDSQGEIMGISAKGWAAKRTKAIQKRIGLLA